MRTICPFSLFLLTQTFILDHPPGAHILLTVINTEGTTIWIVLFIALIFLLFIVSGSEIAFFSLTYKDQNLLKTKQQPYARRITTLLEEPKILLASLQCAGGFLHIVLILMASALMDTFLPMGMLLVGAALVIKILVIACLLLSLCDVLPRVYAAQNNIRFAKFSSWWLDALIVPLFRRTAQFLIAVVCVYLGYQKVRKVRAPEQTIKTTKETVDYLKNARS